MSHIILKNNLFNKILLNPARDYDELCVVSGYATPAMATHHLQAVKDTHNREDLKVNLIIGMTPSEDGISKAHHENFIKLITEKDIFKCSYINPEADPTHTKLYTWLKDGRPQKAFLASANYTMSAFRYKQDEVATECDPEEAYSYYRSKLPLSWYCNIPEAAELVRAEREYIKRARIEREIAGAELANTPLTEIGIEGQDWVRLPLFSERENKVQETAGLNWGQRPGREQNQAYITIPSSIAKTNFFPPLKQEFSVITSDGFPFIFVRAQPKQKDGAIGFALETPNNNSDIGRYFRSRLGLADGAFVSLDDLDRFGNRYVKFVKIDEEEYYMEFEPTI